MSLLRGGSGPCTCENLRRGLTPKAQQGARMPGDHQFLVGRDYPRRHLAGLAGDARRFPRIRVFVELDAEPRRRDANSFADLRRVLSDTCGEHEAVDSAES